MKMPAFKKFFIVLIALSFGLSVPSVAQFQSDSQIKRNFEKDIADANRGVRSVQKVAQADSLLDVINNINSRYQNHNEFLNRVYNPRTVRDMIQELRDLAQVTRERIRRIEQQGDNVVVLEQRISELAQNVTARSQEVDQLRSQLGQMERSRNASAAQARQLRDRVAKYDEFILQLIDSVFVAYDKVDLSSLSPAERRAVALEINLDNVFGHVESVVENNVNFLDTHTQLSTVDFVRLYAVQAEFERMWRNLGSKLGELYLSSEQQQRVRAISVAIDQWGRKIDASVWQSIKAVFDRREIQTKPFTSAASFNAAINSYLNDAISRATESGGSDTEYADYEKFASVWFDDFKFNWQDYMTSSKIMSHRDFVTIDKQVAEWRALAQPAPYAMLMYLGLSLVVILLLLALWIREKSKNKR